MPVPWVTCLLFLSITSSSQAFAYLDPGTGQMILHSTLLMLVSILFYFRKAFYFLRDILQLRKAK